MPKKSDLEMSFLAKALINRFRNSISLEQSDFLLAAGTTRLGKVEFIRTPIWEVGHNDLCQHIEESLLIGVRQKRYSSVGIIKSKFSHSESEIRIHIESNCSYAQAFQIPFRIKRPRYVALGRIIKKETSPRWFCNPFD